MIILRAEPFEDENKLSCYKAPAVCPSPQALGPVLKNNETATFIEGRRFINQPLRLRALAFGHNGRKT